LRGILSELRKNPSGERLAGGLKNKAIPIATNALEQARI